ncbi:MAG: phosphatidylserine decarboxylase [Candidatus Brocadiia bacterium]
MEKRTILASYGRKTWLSLGLALIAASVLSALYAPWISPIFVLGLLFTLWFFRDPERRSDAPPEALLSPADGRVVEIGAAEEPQFLGGPAHKIAIFMSVFDVHVNRSPCDASVDWTRREDGKFLNAMGPQASVENERVLVALRRSRSEEARTGGPSTDAQGRPEKAGKPLLLKLIAGLVARRIVCPLEPGDPLRRGQRLGMIQFGSRVEIFLPRSEKFEPAVRLGQRVRAGRTVLGNWR